MFYFKEKTTWKRKLKYFFFIVGVLRFLVSIYVVYQYFLHTSKQVVAKGGTFVEGIFDTTSFLPYLRNDEQSVFYQGLLFKACLKPKYEGSEIDYDDDLCHVTTADYKTYKISLLSGNTRSDGVPVTIDDVFFTYNDVIKHNIWDLPHLNKYSEIELGAINSNSFTIKFPTASVDNNLLFTNYVLPRHALIEATLKDYKKDFSIQPVYTNCARILPQSTDQYSLVFDLSSCEDTYLGFYQIKNTLSFEDFETSVKMNSSIVDAYMGEKQLSGYVHKNMLTNKLPTIFFNTKSKRIRVRLRRALAGLIKYNFFNDTGVNDIVKEYDKRLFNNFLSTGGNIDSFLGRIDSNQTLTKADLEDVGIKPLPKTVNITGDNTKLVFLTENINNMFTLTLKFDTKYSRVSIRHNNGAEYTPKSYSTKTKSAKYNIGVKLGNLVPGINKYTIYGYTSKGKKEIANIDLYNLKGKITSDDINKSKQQEKLVVLYYRNPTSLAIVQRLQDIFEQYHILDFFSFYSFDSKEEFEGKLLIGDYDIVINTINVGFKQDFSKLFSVDKPQINPSMYINQRFISLLQQFLGAKKAQKDTIIDQINKIHEVDMPFMILGQQYSPLYIKPEVLEKYNGTGDIYDYNWRYMMYKNLRLVKNINIDIKNAGNVMDFVKFIFDNI